ncbi:hypothetical protein M8C21_012732 [Ambrosia artemisiifolia]|uniref:Fe2OG dioxygenase domain-containing protein n=1 Tax=Ambrosia artemisiifolia TaxID=4212 RepID=A0AAD5CFJ2_AMBAR|nr:hypothetical protein M8C21_012732 [Ambrosia artemisiifolia]
MERTPSKLLKDDSLSIYEKTLLKLQQGSQLDLSSVPEESTKTSMSPSVSTVSSNSEPSLTMNAADCASPVSFPGSGSSQSMNISKEEPRGNLSVIAMFSRYKASRSDKIISSDDSAMEIEDYGFSANTSPSHDPELQEGCIIDPPSPVGRKTTNPVCERTPSKLSTYTILEPGMIHLQNYISLKDQVDIVNICQKWAGEFYNPRDPQNGAELNLMMMCFGRNWDPNTGYKERYRSDGSEPPPIPYELISLAEAAVRDAQAILNELPSMHPDICSVNFYPAYGLLDLHQDHDESSNSLRRGLPVVSISIGECAEFVYGHTRAKKKLKKIYLMSGDVLIFGGKSRLIYHGVTQIAQYTSPLKLIEETALRRGRLSLTFRQF